MLLATVRGRVSVLRRARVVLSAGFQIAVAEAVTAERLGRQVVPGLRLGGLLVAAVGLDRVVAGVGGLSRRVPVQSVGAQRGCVRRRTALPASSPCSHSGTGLAARARM